MNIKEFKSGDIITRVAQNKYGDRLFMMEKMEFIGMEVGIIFVLNLENNYGRNGGTFKLSEDIYSEGWDFYPLGLEEEGIKRSKELFPDRWEIADKPSGQLGNTLRCASSSK
ncbi:MAG: hypothetical protein PHQ46_11320 [Negativicutes bacterium]|nr:hypothetical protein [Negativicutes bacterium]